MNAYTWTIRHSTVTFTFTTYADTFGDAYTQATARIAADYPGFDIVAVDIADY